ncbi:MAG: secondary thiamine-phosphate synthase enzyme YjbQ [Terrimicrobiaceae bacterium]|nr:secondary thiamine-phosphate synthase enzyme YjbQ [Terrimicrobiaceae bacterium]
MIVRTTSLTVPTRGKGLYEITEEIARAVSASDVSGGTVTAFVRHTSASLVIFENADPTAAQDLVRWFERMVPEDARGFAHTLEGPDDMTSHIRMTLTRTSETIPITRGKLALGTWQGVFLFEHRRAPHRREGVLSVCGVAAQ